MAAALEGVESGRITWSILAATQDTNDADREPNFGSFRGAVMFTPSRSSVRRLLPTPYTIFLDPVLGNVGDDGILRDLSGLEGVVLVSPFATGIEETGWDWEVSFQLNQREKVSFPIQFQPDEVLDLSRATPVISTPGTVMTKGEKGDNATIAIGNVTTGSAGSSADVDNVGTPTAAVLDFVIPKGDKGDMPQVTSTSTTTVAISSTALRTLTTQTGMSYAVGMLLRVAVAADLGTFMAGYVTAYDPATGQLTVDMVESGGSGGTHSNWVISMTGPRGSTGAQGTGYTSRGAWVTGTAYAVRDIVTSGGSVFEVLTAHTSSGSAPTVATPGANYRLWAQKGDIGNTGPSGTITSATASGLGVGAAPTVTLGGTPEARTMAFGIPVGATGATGPGFTWRGAWAASTAYAFRDVVTANGSVFMVHTAHTSGAVAPTWQTPGANLTVWARQGDQGPTGAGSPDATAVAKGSIRLAGDLYGTADAPLVESAADRAYVRAFAATDLVVNGTAYLGDNTNFSDFTLDPTDSPVGGGSFDPPAGIGDSYKNDELIPIDLSRRYLLRFQIRQKTAGVVSYFYGAVSPYDTEGLPITPANYNVQANTTTTLAAALKPGDTTVTLTSAANWNNAAGSSTHMRRFIVWNYVDGNGKAWGPLTFSRRYSPSDTYADGAISGNVITLRAPFDPTAWGYPAGYTIPAGTSISNGSSGGTFMYGNGMQNAVVPEPWTILESIFIGGQMPVTNGGRDAATANTGWPPGTAFVKLAWILNTGSGGVGNIAGSRVSIASVSFSDATATEKDIRDATRNSVGNSLVRRDGVGDVFFNKVFVNTAAASATELTRKDYVDAEVAKKITAFADPNADRMVFWDDSAGAFAALTPGATIPISGTTIDVRAGTEAQTGVVELATAAETTTGTDNTRAVHPQGLKVELDKKVTGVGILKAEKITKADYDALVAAGTTVGTTLYVIVG